MIGHILHILKRGLLLVLVFLTIPATTSLIGFYSGVGIANWINAHETVTSWKLIDPLPERPIRLLAASGQVLFIETDMGTFYWNRCSQRHNGPCWEDIEWPANVYSNSCEDWEFPEPPGNVIASVEDCFFHEYTEVSKYVLLSDGSLWAWRVNTSNSMTQLGRGFTGMISGFIAGLVAGLILAIKLFPRIRRHAIWQ